MEEYEFGDIVANKSSVVFWTTGVYVRNEDGRHLFTDLKGKFWWSYPHDKFEVLGSVLKFNAIRMVEL